MNLIGNISVKGLLILTALIGVFIKKWTIDNDTWFILNCGRYVIDHGIPHIEFASMHEDLHYVMEQWLTAVIFWKVYSWFSFDGIFTVTWIVGVLIFLVYHRICLMISDGNNYVSFVMTLIVCMITTLPFIVTRPQIFSMLLLLIETLILEKVSRNISTNRWLLILPIISIACVNLHSAMWPLTLIIILPFAAESFLSKLHLINSTSQLSVKTAIFTMIIVFLAGFVNPYGWEAMTFVFYSYDPTIHNYIVEVSPTSISYSVGKVFFLTAAGLIVMYSRKKLPIRYLLLSLGFAIIGISTFRGTFFFFMFATLPIAYACKDRQPSIVFNKSIFSNSKVLLLLFSICVLESLKFFLDSNFNFTIFRANQIFLLLMFLCLLGFVLFYRIDNRRFSLEIPVLSLKSVAVFLFLQLFFLRISIPPTEKNSTFEPYKPAIDFLLEHNQANQIVLWTGFHSGGYAGFRGIKYYIDARPEIFAKSNNLKSDIISEYFALRFGTLDYREFFKRYKFTHIMVTSNDRLLYILLTEDDHYRMIFDDEKIKCRIFEPIKDIYEYEEK